MPLFMGKRLYEEQGQEAQVYTRDAITHDAALVFMRPRAEEMTCTPCRCQEQTTQCPGRSRKKMLKFSVTPGSVTRRTSAERIEGSEKGCVNGGGLIGDGFTWL